MSFADLIYVMDQQVLTHLSGAEVVTFVTGDDESVLLSAIYDASFQLMGAGTPGVQSDSPQIFFSLSLLRDTLGETGYAPEEDDGARVMIDGVSHKIRETQPDGQGGVMMLLHIDKGAP